MRSANLYRVLAALLLLIACALAVTHLVPLGTLNLGGTARIAAGAIAGFAIGIVAAIMGVAGRRADHSYCGAAVRPRHQGRRNPVPPCVAPDHARRLRR